LVNKILINKNSNFALVGHGYHLFYFFQKIRKVLNKNPVILTHKKKYHQLESKLNNNRKINKDIFKLRKYTKVYEISNLNSLTTNKILDENDIEYIFSFSSRFIFKKKILNKFKNKIFNLHPTLLPEERGAGTFTNRILNEKNFVCACFHIVNNIIDGGDILLKANKVRISKNSLPENFLEKTNLCYKKLIDKFIYYLKNKKNFRLKKQNSKKHTYFSRYNSEINGIIDWYQSGRDINNFIKGFSKPYSGASTNIFFKKKIFKIKIFNSKFFKKEII
jgi:methionyl-tRNA formyltransferase